MGNRNDVDDPGIHSVPASAARGVERLACVACCHSAAAVAIVYKSIKCKTMSEVPKQSLQAFFWILVGMATAAGVLLALEKVLEWR